MRIANGVDDQYIYFVAIDPTDLKTREPGLSDFTVYRSRNGGTPVAMTEPTIIEPDATNMPGVYALLMDEDMSLAAENDTEEMCFHIEHASILPVSKMVEIYLPVWDDLLTGATHNISTSAGRKMREAADAAIVRSEELAQGGSLSTIILHDDASILDGFYDGCKAVIVEGTGAGQVRALLDYVGSTRTADVCDPWIVAVDDTSKYLLRGHAGVHLHGLTTDGGAAIKAEVVKALNVDTYAEPGQGKPSATLSIAAKIGYMFKAWRNKKDNDGITRKLYGDDRTTVHQKSAVSEDDGTVIVDEVDTGP